MMDDRRVVWAIVGTITLVLGVIFLSEPVQRELRPDPQRAFIAIEVGGEGVARPGRVELGAGAPFELHAVLEAEGRRGRTIYYTEAPGLEIDGERVADDGLRPFPGPEEAKVLWFSVEGPRPFVELGASQSVGEIPFQAIFRPEWPRAWSIHGDVRSAREASAPAGGDTLKRESFGTQRFKVRIELFGLSSALVPVATYESSPEDTVLSNAESYATVTASLEGALALPSRVFGLTQLDIPAERLENQGTDLQRLFDADLAFSRSVLLRAMLDWAGRGWEDLDWQPVELAVGPSWGDGSVQEGHLLKAGERVVVLYRDRGELGKLDYEDLCMDFLEGAQVRPLREVFAGEGLVEWAALVAG